MRLSFMIERAYAPYSKWFGAAFSRLAIAGRLGPLLDRALTATDWRARQRALVRACGIVGEAHNGLGVTPRLKVGPRRFYSRPFVVVGADRFAGAIVEAVGDRRLQKVESWGGGAGG